MYVELQSREVKSTRKAHRCEWCWQVIPIGSVAYYRAYYFDGDFASGHMHPECRDAMDRSDPRDLGDGWMPGDFPRGGDELY